jgi:CRP-like cAMP-binding protein
VRPSTPGHLHIDSLFGSLGSAKKVVYFRKGQIVFSQGDRSNSLFYIQQGSVKFTVTSRKGKEAIIAILDGGSVFGVDALDADRPPHSSNAIALTDVRAAKIDPDAMLRLIYSEGDACDLFLTHLIKLNAKLTADLAHHLLYSSEIRLARALSSIAKLYGDAQHQPLPKLDQQDLANMIGVTRQRVNGLLKRFRKLGYVDDAHGLSVHRSILNIAGQDYAARNGSRREP